MKGVVTGLRLFRAGWIVCTLVAVAVTASAQESLDAKQIVGKWVGTLRAVGQPPATAEVEFKPDGAFEGGSNSGQSGQVSYAGRWKVDGKTILVDYIADGSRGKAEVSWTLKANGEELSGAGYRMIGNVRFDVNLKRVK
jgi:uncharacterized protein (TIGR03066 family)